MKKVSIAFALGLMVAAASAADVSVSVARDHASDVNGYRVGTEVRGVSLSATHIPGQYDRVAVGKEVSLFSVSNFNFRGSVAGTYQRTLTGAQDGYGVTAGVGVSYPLTKNINAFANIERFEGQERVNQFNGNISTVGINYRF